MLIYLHLFSWEAKEALERKLLHVGNNVHIETQHIAQWSVFVDQRKPTSCEASGHRHRRQRRPSSVIRIGTRRSNDSNAVGGAVAVFGDRVSDWTHLSIGRTHGRMVHKRVQATGRFLGLVGARQQRHQFHLILHNVETVQANFLQVVLSLERFQQSEKILESERKNE